MLSQYFNNFSATKTNEMRLMEDVINESINIMGHGCHYLPREAWNGDDRIFGENAQSRFKRAYTLPVYLANVEGYEGDGDFFSKFGLEIRDTSNFVVSRRAFERYVPSNIAIRPREGDLIFVPIMNKIFEIKFVEEELMFFSLGNRNPYVYELRCELFRYSNESIDVGISEVDHVEHTLSYTIQLQLGAGTADYNIGETVYLGANLAYSTASAEVKEWDRSNNTIYLMNIKGDFSNGTILIGQDSGTSYPIANTDLIGDFLDYDIFDNRDLQTDAELIINRAETNPFGEP